jgi:hypothetical protein
MLADYPDENVQIVFESHSFADLAQMITTHRAKLRIVTQQVSQFGTLMNEVRFCQACHLLLETADSEQVAQNVARIIEARRLIEVAG